MPSTSDFSGLFARSHSLSRGPRVRLRIPTVRDARAIADLLRSQGLDPEELALARLVRCDPRRRVVVAASGLLDGREELLGIGSIDLEGETVEPELVIVDGAQTDGLTELIERALIARAQSLGRIDAA